MDNYSVCAEKLQFVILLMFAFEACKTTTVAVQIFFQQSCFKSGATEMNHLSSRNHRHRLGVENVEILVSTFFSHPLQSLFIYLPPAACFPLRTRLPREM